MHEFGVLTRSALDQAGWSESRVFDTTSYERACATFGRHASATAMRFLSSFGNLTLTFPHPRIDGAFDTCHFHAESAASTIDPETVREYEGRTGGRLSVVGEAFSGHMVLVMDDDGRLFGGYDDLLLKFGDTPAEALDCICEGRDGIPVDEHEPSTPETAIASTLTEEAERELSRAGWSRGRFADRATGSGSARPPSPTPSTGLACADGFLREFGGLTFPIKLTGSAPGACEISSPPVSPALRRVIDQLEATLGRRLATVGRLRPSGAMLLMSEQGHVIMCIEQTPDIAWRMGRSGVEAINNLIAGSVAPRIV